MNDSERRVGPTSGRRLAIRARNLVDDMQAILAGSSEAPSEDEFRAAMTAYFIDRTYLTRTIDELYAVEYQLAVLMAEKWLGGVTDLPEPPDVDESV